MALIKSFTCLVCKRRRLRKSAFIHPLTRLCRWCAKPMKKKMEDSGRTLEGYILEFTLQIQEDERPGL